LSIVVGSRFIRQGRADHGRNRSPSGTRQQRWSHGLLVGGAAKGPGSHVVSRPGSLIGPLLRAGTAFDALGGVRRLSWRSRWPISSVLPGRPMGYTRPFGGSQPAQPLRRNGGPWPAVAMTVSSASVAALVTLRSRSAPAAGGRGSLRVRSRPAGRRNPRSACPRVIGRSGGQVLRGTGTGPAKGPRYRGKEVGWYPRH